MDNQIRKGFLLLFLLCDFLAYSQDSNIRFEHLTVDNGLSQNYIMSILQDSRGFLWIGTQDGLNRYDGYEFKIYRHMPGNENSLPEYAVNRLCEDEDGNLWIGTREGLSRFDPALEKFTNFKHNPEDRNSLSNSFITFLKTDNSGRLWIGTMGGLNLYNKEQNNFTHFLNNPSDSGSLSDNHILSIEQDNEGYLWIGTLNGLNKFHPSGNKFIQFLPENDRNSLSHKQVFSIVIIDKTIWAGTRSGLNKISLNPSGEYSFKHYYFDYHNPPPNQVNKLALQSDDILWLGTASGLIKFNIKTEEHETFINNKYDSKSLSMNFINALLIDKSNVLWAGTTEKGLNKLTLTSERFTNYTHKFNSQHSINNSNVQAVFEDKDGTLWVGTQAGINKISSRGKSAESISFLTDRNGLNHNNIHSIIKDRYGDIWIGTFGGGITRINSSSGKITSYTKENTGGTVDNFIHTIYEDRNGDIWIGTGLGGVLRFIRKQDSFIIYRNNPADSNSLPKNEVIAILEDKNRIIWFGTTTGGLSRYDRDKNKFTNYIHITDDLESLSSNRIVTLFEDSKGRIWIGTFGGGLNLFDAETEKFIHYTSDDGLAGNIVSGITEDNIGNLWISTNKGISRFTVEKSFFRNYDVNDGLQGNEFNENAVYKSRITDILLFGGENGLTIFSPANIKDDTTIPQIVFTDFRLFNNSVQPGENSVLKKSILFSDEITISYKDNIFSFGFASLHFANPHKNQYAYMLEGFDKDWVYAGNKNSATYTNIDPGDYVFRVKGSNGDGIWNEKGISLKLTITPPLWRTWWAYIIYTGIIISAFFAIRRFELNRVMLKNELELKDFQTRKLQEVDQLKSRFFANISHEFRTPLTIILGSLDKLRHRATDKLNLRDYDVMKRNASRLLQLINQLLELSKIESGTSKLQATENDLIKFLNRIIASFSSLAYQKKIGIYFNGVNSSVEKSSGHLKVYFDKEKMETVFYNLMANAIKFTPTGGRIDIDVSRDNEFINLSFTNTGIEIPAEKLPHIFDRFYQVDDSGTRNFEGTGIGLSLVKELVELHKGTIEAASNNLKTTFAIRLKSGKSHLSGNDIVEDKFTVEETMITPLPSAFEIPAEIKNKQETHTDSTIILIVEDNPDLREFIKEQLEKEYSVIEAENGGGGISLADEIIPDLVISDIMMPVMDGFELCRLLKTNEKTNHIPVILLTAKAEMEDKLEGLETGADDYLVKPFNPEELRVRVKNLIKLRQQMREKYRSEMLVKPSEIIVPSVQKIFIDKLASIIEKNIENENFTIELLCNEIGMSRAQLHRKIKAITNQSTTEFIRNFRLQRAADLIKKDAGNIAEIAYKVGFNSQAYFTKSFQETFGCSPSEYKKKSQG